MAATVPRCGQSLEDEKEMIVRMDVNGRPANVAYLDKDRKPTTEALAELIEVHFLDEGNGTVWLVPQSHAHKDVSNADETP